MEVSSHALDQGRVDGVRSRRRVHQPDARPPRLPRDMERYAEAKARLFRLPGLEHAVINVDDPVGARFAAALGAGVELDRGRRRRRGARGARASCTSAATMRPRTRPRARDPRPLRRAAPALAPDRRVQRRESRRHARRAARLGSSRWTTSLAALGACARAARTHGRLRLAERRARGRRLRAHARRAREGARGGARALRAAACSSCSAAAATAIPASAR